jgi:hypothetical protein
MEKIELELNFELGKLNKNSNRIIHKLKAKNAITKQQQQKKYKNNSEDLLKDIDKVNENKYNNIKFYNFIYEVFGNNIKDYIDTRSDDFKTIEKHYNLDNINNVDNENILRNAMNEILPYKKTGKENYNVYNVILYFMFFYIFIDDKRSEKEKFQIINKVVKGYKVLHLQDIFPLENKNDNMNIEDINPYNNSFIESIKNENDSLSNFMKMMGYKTELENISGGGISQRKRGLEGFEGQAERSTKAPRRAQNNYTHIRHEKGTNSGYYVKYVFVKYEDISDEEKKDIFNKILKNMAKTIKQEEIDIEEEELNIKSVSETDEIKFCEYKGSNNIELAPIRLSDKTNKKFYEKGYFDVSDTIRSKFKFNELDRIITIRDISTDKRYENYLKIFSYNVYNNKELSTNVFTNNCNNINSNDFKFICLQEFNKTDINNTNNPIIYNIKLKFSMNFKKNKIFINDLIDKGILNGLIERDGNKYKINVRNYNDNYYIIIVPDKLQEKNVNMKYLAILIRKEANPKVEDLNKYNAFISLLDDTKENKRRRICLAIKDSDKEEKNTKCIINVHLSTNIEFKIQHSELSYLLNKIIKKETFFKKSVKNDNGKRMEELLDNIIIMGDFNLDAHEIGTEILKSKTIEENYYANVLFNNIVTRNSLCVDISNGKKSKHEGQNLDNIILLNKNRFQENVKVAVGYNMYSFKDCRNQIICENQKLSDHSPIFSCIDINNIKNTSVRKKQIESSEDISVKYKNLKNMESAKLLSVIGRLAKKGKITRENILKVVSNDKMLVD